MWSYDPGQLANSKLMQTRLLIGDVTAKDPQLQDEEIAQLLVFRGSVYGAAADGCRAIASNLSRQADSVQGDIRVMYSARARNYGQRALQYETQAQVRSGGMPYAGGISISDKQQVENDADRVTPQFNIGQDDNTLPFGPMGNEVESEVNDTGITVDE